MAKTTKVASTAAPVAKKAAKDDSSSDDSSSDEDVKQVVKKPVAKATPTPTKAAKKAESSSDSSSSEDEAPAKPAKKTPGSPAKKPAAAPASPLKKPTPAPKAAPKKADSSDSDSSSEDEKPAAKAAPKANGKAAAAAKPTPMDSDDSDSSSEDEKPAAKPAPAAKANGAAAKRKADSDSDSSSSSEDEAPAKKAKAETPAAEKRKQAPAPVNGQKAKKLKVDTEDNGDVAPMDDDAPAAPQTPGKSENGDAGNNKIFASGFPYETTKEEIESFFADCGTIKELSMPVWPDSGKFKGLAFIDFEDADAANKALEKDGQDFGGRYLKISLSNKPTTPGRSPREQGPSVKPDGCLTVFVGNLSWNATEDDVRAAFSECGTITNVRVPTDRETGQPKGFAFVDFEDTAATDAAVALSGTEVAGRAIRVDFQGQAGDRPRGSFGPGNDRGGRGRGGDRGGFRGRGGDRGGFRGRGDRGGFRGRGGDRGGRGGGFNKRGGLQGFAGKKTTFDD